ncbi:hypothetical protein [Microcystis aeruginosa]|uniref:SPOR domain-containing protein n=1 Tax=Microcystis aeruginosa PCC 9443 TaxID=1160281 RepID=I4G326_MICAE|nr:hypothetical protein [Microcystis aeruginosa]CCI02337.1 exported hypothetical protein [Microcystis aeruginosa PCC 9443]
MKKTILILWFLLGIPVIARAEQWGVVFGGDRDINEAQYEINRAKKNRPPYSSAVLFYRSGWYRSVILFQGKKEAQAALTNIHNQLRQGSYVVNVDDWCPNWQSNRVTSNKISFYRCL